MFNSISTWFTALSPTMQVFWACAIAASVVFVIQNTLMLLGLGDMDSDMDASADAEFDTGGDTDVSADQPGHTGTLGAAGIFSLFTLRNFINFFLGFGWGGISLSPVVQSQTLLVILSFIIGLLFVVAFVFLLRALLKLEHKGNFKIQDCEGQIASVYLRIPAAHAGAGKIQISINGSVHELSAFTDEDQMLATGSRVRVVKVIDSNSLLVESV